MILRMLLITALFTAAAPLHRAAPVGPLDAAGPNPGAAAVVVASAPQDAAGSPADALDAAIDGWIASLAEEGAFTSWKGAVWSKSPLGPGTHGWIVWVRAPGSGESLGYLIVAAKPEGGYVLLEYGTGGEGPFSEAVFQAVSAPQDKSAQVEKLYYDPLHAFWRVTGGKETVFADAVTGAQLPVNEDRAAALVPEPWPNLDPLQTQGKRIHLVPETADPYTDLTWLDMPDAGIADWNGFTAWFERDDKAGVYIGTAFDGQLLVPFGVSGYHWWTDSDGVAHRFAALDQEGLIRFVPLAPLLKYGTFR